MSKIWKRIGIIILVVACLWNITVKLLHKISFDDAVNATKIQIEKVKNNIKN